MMHAHVSGHAMPQVAVTQDRRFSASRAAVFDLRNIGSDIETLDVFASHTVAQALTLLRTLHDVDSVLQHLCAARLRCKANLELVPFDSPLGGGVDVVLLETTDVPWQRMWPPTPPVPDPVDDATPTWTDPPIISEGFSATTSSLQTPAAAGRACRSL